MADLSSSITSGGTAQNVASADALRGTFYFENTSDTEMRIKFGGTATATDGVMVESGQFRSFGKNERPIITQAISVFCATTGKTFTAYDGHGYGD